MLKIIESVATGPTRIHHSINSKTATQCCSLTYNIIFKSHPGTKAHVNYRLLLYQHNETFNIG